MDIPKKRMNEYVGCAGVCASAGQPQSPTYKKRDTDSYLIPNSRPDEAADQLASTSSDINAEKAAEQLAIHVNVEESTVEYELNVMPNCETGNTPDNVAPEEGSGEVAIGVDNRPAWYMCLLLGFQHYIIMFGACTTTVFLILDALCIGEDEKAKAEVIGTTFFCCGIVTLIQSVLGVRLPIVQGASFTYVVPVTAILKSSRPTCNSFNTSLAASTITSIVNSSQSLLNTTTQSTENITIDSMSWQQQMLEIQGAILIASLLEIIIGFSGFLGFILQWVGPLVVAPTVTLIGLNLFDFATDMSSNLWWIALVTVLLLAVFSQYTKKITLPVCHYDQTTGCTRDTIPLFLYLPVLLSVAITWLLYTILLYAGVYFEKMQNDNSTTVKLEALEAGPWLYLPYPGQWGLPRVTVTSILGVLTAVLGSIVESIGDYYTCARMSDVPPPPAHAINRGIGVEGIGTLIFGAFGCGTGTTSYSENIGSLGVNKVASRIVIQCAALFMILFGIFPRLATMFVLVPEPIMGGVYIVMFGMVAGIGLSNLQFIDMNSSRNLFIIGASFFFGIALPKFAGTEGNIDTGNETATKSIELLLRSGMLVGGLTAFILDNTIPGTKKERGLEAWRKWSRQKKTEAYISRMTIYDLPFLSDFIRDKGWCKYVPFLPTFNERLLKLRRSNTQTSG